MRINFALPSYLSILFLLMLTACAGGNDDVNIRDTMPPVITLNGESSITIIQGDEYIEFGATAIDERDGDVGVTLSGTVDTNVIGSYTITYTATDSSNNSSSLTRAIIVQLPPDITPPVIALNGESDITIFRGDEYVELGATALDERDGEVDVTVSGIIDTSIIGIYSITYTATDNANNTSSVLRSVVVSMRPFITIWKTDNSGFSGGNQIKIGTFGDGYDYQVDWGDNTFDEHVSGDIVHTYSAAGTYTVTISETFPQIYFGSAGDEQDEYDSRKLLSIEQWGDIQWQSMKGAFYRTRYLSGNAIDTPNLSQVTDMSEMFRASLFNQDIGGWDVSSVTNMSEMFSSYWDAFDTIPLIESLHNIGNWNVSSVMDMSMMFSGTEFENFGIEEWDVSSVTNMFAMFAGLYFNEDIGNWDVSSVTNMKKMFHRTYNFDQDIGNWDVSSVVDMSYMFSSWGGQYTFKTKFNQDIGGWNVSSVTDMTEMFRYNKYFNQYIGNWDVSSVTSLSGMFSETSSFNQDIGSWDVSSVTTMNYMFSGNRDPIEGSAEQNMFDQDIGNWDVSSVTDMGYIFWGGEDIFGTLPSNLSTANYDALLKGWSAQNLQNGVDLVVSTTHSISAQDARDILTNVYNWNITDNGVEP